MLHKNITGDDAVHPAAFYAGSDPGAVGAGKFWIDTTTGPPWALKVRDSGNAAWEDVGSAGGATTLAALTDVDLSGLTSGDFLKWNGSFWVPDVPTGTGAQGFWTPDVPPASPSGIDDEFAAGSVSGIWTDPDSTAATPTAVAAKSMLLMDAQGHSGLGLQRLLATIATPANDWTAVLKTRFSVDLFSVSTAANSWAGMWVKDSVSTHSLFFGMGLDSSSRPCIILLEFDGATPPAFHATVGATPVGTTVAGNVGVTQLNASDLSRWVWLRCSKSTGNAKIIFEFSFDGLLWQSCTAFNYAFPSAYITNGPDKIGPFIYSSSFDYTKAYFDYFRFDTTTYRSDAPLAGGLV